MLSVSDIADTQPKHELHIGAIPDTELGSGLLEEAEYATLAGMRLLYDLQYIKDLVALVLPVIHQNEQYLYFCIQTRLRNHLHWKLLSTARCTKEGTELGAEQLARVDREYLQSLVEDIALEVLRTSYTGVSESLDGAQL